MVLLFFLCHFLFISTFYCITIFIIFSPCYAFADHKNIIWFLKLSCQMTFTHAFTALNEFWKYLHQVLCNIKQCLLLKALREYASFHFYVWEYVSAKRLLGTAEISVKKPILKPSLVDCF